MPTYTYRCEQCGTGQDAMRRMAERDEGPRCCGARMVRIIVPTMITPDIAVYRSVAADKETGKQVMIESRRQHHEFLKRNDYIEVG